MICFLCQELRWTRGPEVDKASVDRQGRTRRARSTPVKIDRNGVDCEWFSVDTLTASMRINENEKSGLPSFLSECGWIQNDSDRIIAILSDSCRIKIYLFSTNAIKLTVHVVSIPNECYRINSNPPLQPTTDHCIHHLTTKFNVPQATAAFPFAAMLANVYF